MPQVKLASCEWVSGVMSKVPQLWCTDQDCACFSPRDGRGKVRFSDAAGKRSGPAQYQATTAAPTSESLPAEFGGRIFRHAFRITARARHRHVLPRSAYPPHST